MVGLCYQKKKPKFLDAMKAIELYPMDHNGEGSSPSRANFSNFCVPLIVTETVWTEVGMLISATCFRSHIEMLVLCDRRAIPDLLLAIKCRPQ